MHTKCWFFCWSWKTTLALAEQQLNNVEVCNHYYAVPSTLQNTHTHRPQFSVKWKSPFSSLDDSFYKHSQRFVCCLKITTKLTLVSFVFGGRREELAHEYRNELHTLIFYSNDFRNVFLSWRTRTQKKNESQRNFHLDFYSKIISFETAVVFFLIFVCFVAA